MRCVWMLRCFAVLTILLTIGAEDAAPNRRRRCRCQRYLKEVNVAIDKKLKAFEDKFTNFLSPLQNILTNDSAKLENIDNKMAVLGGNINDTRDVLKREGYSLRVLQETLYSQEVTVDNLNENFKTLDGIVRNLSSVVEKLEKLVSSKGFGNNSDSTAVSLADSPDRHGPLVADTYPEDCQAVYASGGMRYQGDYYIMIKPKKAKTPFKAHCKIFNNSGWTVIQKRQDGSVDFYRTWEEYKRGFGNLQSEFWLGNDNMHHLTSQDKTMLRIEMTSWNGKQYFAEYDGFRVGSESDLYRLHVNGYSGNAGDSLTPYWRTHDGRAFSTKDRDNDDRFHDNCAEHYHGAWWFNNCFESHLNGKYYQNGSHNDYFVRDGVQWNSIHSYSSLMSVEMMIKPVNVDKLPNDI